MLFYNVSLIQRIEQRDILFLYICYVHFLVIHLLKSSGIWFLFLFEFDHVFWLQVTITFAEIQINIYTMRKNKNMFSFESSMPTADYTLFKK